MTMTTETVINRSAISRGKKIVLVVFIIWIAQAIPKWTAAIVADGETSAKIVGFFITPRAETSDHQRPALNSSKITASHKSPDKPFASDAET